MSSCALAQVQCLGSVCLRVAATPMAANLAAEALGQMISWDALVGFVSGAWLMGRAWDPQQKYLASLLPASRCCVGQG